jgi:pyruvate/2-oxoacid:ferredoxin oxidoreductase alpha subunit
MSGVDWEYLKKMTKEEIIAYFSRHYYYRSPSKDDVDKFIKSYRNEKQYNEIEKRLDALMKRGPEIKTMAKKHDELAKKFNAMSHKERIETGIIDKLVEIEKEIKDHYKIIFALQDMQNKIVQEGF